MVKFRPNFPNSSEKWSKSGQKLKFLVSHVPIFGPKLVQNWAIQLETV